MKRFVLFAGKLFRRGYALLFAFVFIFYIVMAVLPARLMLGGHENGAKLIYKGFYCFCHQYPWRSWFLGGAQSHYPLDPASGSGLLSFDEASGLRYNQTDARRFYGTAEMGYKMAVCQRDVAIYGTMGLFCLLFFLSGNRIPRIHWALWLILGVLPMAVDGIGQLAGSLLPESLFRESTPLLRTVTGALFGLFSCWYLLPVLENSLREGGRDDCQ